MTDIDDPTGYPLGGGVRPVDAPDIAPLFSLMSEAPDSSDSVAWGLLLDAVAFGPRER